MLNEAHVKKSEHLSTYLLVFSIFLVTLVMVVSNVFILTKIENLENFDFYSLFTVLIFYFIFVVYIIGGKWMLKLMKKILVPVRFQSCRKYLLKIIISGSIVSFL